MSTGHGIGLTDPAIIGAQESAYIEKPVTGFSDAYLELANIDLGNPTKLLIFVSCTFSAQYTVDESFFTINGATGQWKRDGATGLLAIWRNDDNSSNAVGIVGTIADEAGKFNMLASIDADDGGDGHAEVHIWQPTGKWSLSGTDTVVPSLWDGGGSQDFQICRSGVPILGNYYRMALWKDVLPASITAEVLAGFANADTGALVDPAFTRTLYGDPLIDFNGEASRWNAGEHDGTIGAFTKIGSGSFSDA